MGKLLLNMSEEVQIWQNDDDACLPKSAIFKHLYTHIYAFPRKPMKVL